MIAVVDSGGANLGSVLFALARLGAAGVVTDDPAVIASSERVILPGVGAAGAAMDGLRSRGLIPVLRALTQPVLGICLGMQILYEASEEGATECLGVLPGVVRRLTPRVDVTVPHMGWNTVYVTGERPAPLLGEADEWFYFVHSYVAPLGPEVVALSDHGEPFPAVVSSRNWSGTQFHPERSGGAGERLLRRFLAP